MSHGGRAVPASLSQGTGDPLNSLQLRLSRAEVIRSGARGKQKVCCVFVSFKWFG